MRYRNVEGVRMTEQTDREHHNGNGNKKNMRMLREAWAESNPAHCNEKHRKNTKRRHKTWVLRKPGFELKPNHVCKQRVKRKMKSATWMMKQLGSSSKMEVVMEAFASTGSFAPASDDFLFPPWDLSF